MRYRSVPQPGWSFEYIMWIFTRISGLTLLALALMSCTVALLMGARTELNMPSLLRWSFFPNPNHVVDSGIPDVTQGWSNAFWQIIQMIAVLLAISHGSNGLRVVLEDFLGKTILQPMLRGGIFLLWMFTLVVAFYVILAS
jgi:succinate dehydrogenase / fumarate reductase membrane anchor subunit